MDFSKLLKVQQALKPIIKDSDNPFFKSKYADINSVLAEVRPILNTCGVVIMQPTRVVDGRTLLLTYLLDAETGEQLGEASMILPDIADPQKMLAAITYYRRGELVSILALEQEDDDGNTATAHAPEKAVSYRVPANETYLKVKPEDLPPCEACGGGRKYVPPGLSKANKPYKGFYPCMNGCKKTADGRKISTIWEDFASDLVANK